MKAIEALPSNSHQVVFAFLLLSKDFPFVAPYLVFLSDWLLLLNNYPSSFSLNQASHNFQIYKNLFFIVFK